MTKSTVFERNGQRMKRMAKRLLAGILCVGMCLLVFVGAAPEEKGTKLILGEMIYLFAEGDAEELINNSGMSGLESSVHLAGTDAKDMCVLPDGQPVVLALPRAEMVGQVYIWNYNEEGKLNCGVKELKVQYSIDGSAWTDFGTVTLPQSNEADNTAYGGTVACNLDTPIDFGGIPAKYIALTAVSNHGGEFSGLSEVRVFRHKTRPQVDGMIYGQVINTTAGTTPEAVFNNQGMSDLTGKKATHNNNPADMWLSSEPMISNYLPVDLDGTYPVSSVTIWNYNDPANLDSGVKEFEIYYTVDAPCAINTKTEKRKDMWGDMKDVAVEQTFDFSRGDWRKVEINGESKFTLPKGTGDANMGASLTLVFDEVIEAQHMKIVPVSNHGGSGTGLSEVRFFAGKGWGVEPARLWSGLLSSSGSFAYQGYGKSELRDGNGWIYADGIYSYHMNGAQSQGSLREDSVVFVTFEDTCVGNMNNYKNFNSATGYKASHNGWTNGTFLVIKGNKPDVRNIQFILFGKNSYNDPNGMNNIWPKKYWTGDMTLINGDLYVHAPDISNQAAGTPVDMVKVVFNSDLTPNMDVIPEIVAENIPAFADGTVYENTKEAGAPNPDGYIYVFTEKKKGQYRVCRAKPEDYVSNFDKYEFWGGDEKGWVVGDESVTTPIKANVSSYDPGGEAAIAYMSEGYFGGKYVNVFTEDSISGHLKMGVSTGLTDGFSGEFREDGTQAKFPFSIFFASEKYKYVLYRGYDAFNMWGYNAKSHPVLSEEGELLISYHIGAQQSQSNTMGMEYTHPVFVNMFSIGDFEGGVNILLFGVIGGAVLLVGGLTAVAVVVAKKGKKKETAE